MRPRQEPVIESIFRELQRDNDRLDEKYPVSPQSRYRFSDCLKSLFALFPFRQPNLYRFEIDYFNDASLRSAIQRLLALRSVPSDTTIRRVLDRLSPAALRPFFKTVFRYAQRQKLFEPFRSP
ncbi:MAG: hypothetical protein F4039_00335 [Gammaproteobacteria bacterium]|nr:hypothetical protein [Gammaproteobacteria bacterium]MXX95664.1 hypothetical protein [Gammaproteobacteria bacterium]MYF52474.1 hypothetical protein [Gammaproteobacteria bacterium]MYK42527.1 hypothetical protein [Gammaproteobacteria bacterium]